MLKYKLIKDFLNLYKQIIKTKMDTKTARRNFYLTKVYLSQKNDDKYNPERFSQELQNLLDEYMPKATLKQLTKFMNKKYQKIVKHFPQIQKPLKKIIKDKINKIPEELSKSQSQKILSYIQETYYDMKLTQKEAQKGTYQLLQKNEPAVVGAKHTTALEEICIQYSSLRLKIDASLKENQQKPCYRFYSDHTDYAFDKIFASTEVIKKQKMDVKRGNFTRQVNLKLEKFNSFVQKITQIEESQ